MRSRPLLLVAACLTLALSTGAAFTFLGSRWSGAQVVMHLQLGSGGTLLDGSPSWDVVAERALATWNRYLSGLQFAVVRNSPVTPGDGDRVNNVIFDSTIYGFSFGNAVAVTTEWTRNNGRQRLEADVILNSNLAWNSYRGPLRRAAGGRTLYDVERVLLHEFGHVLGLDHPDEAGQRVVAIMNSRVSDLDALRGDDIRGAQALYGARNAAIRAAFTRPSRPATSTRSARFTLRGTADPGQADAVLLVNNRLGARRFLRASGLDRWSRVLPLRPGTNRIRLYILTPDGRRIRIDERVINRR